MVERAACQCGGYGEACRGGGGQVGFRQTWYAIGCDGGLCQVLGSATPTKGLTSIGLYRKGSLRSEKGKGIFCLVSLDIC